MFEVIKNIAETANRIGLPIPVIIIVVVFYRILISRVEKWSKREKYYEILLTNLGIWRENLSSQLDYYQQPGSEYGKEPETTHYVALSKRAADASAAIMDNLHFGKIFLSDNSVKSIEQLFSEDCFRTIMAQYVKRTIWK